MKSLSPASDSPQPLSAVEGVKKQVDELVLPYPHVKKSASASSSEADANPQAVKTDDWRNVYKRAAFAPSPASYSREEGDAAFPIDGKGKQAMETLNNSEVKEEEESPKKEIKEQEEVKVWNLRPRVAKSKTTNNAKTTKSAGNKKDNKVSIAIALAKEEIEEDIFALTGAKPSRRPKKRPKNVQKQLDAVFPGLWLHSISADSYKVSENSHKG
ncbi:uncharacterized protein LOC125194616 [Salvia hispanica]|uniref:uncharacterized protein LOC125194616 n=1 Tax=Salvia hispanica TaxID=49212 RepID=UPI002009A81E|nr:uncharacterized protein LOC125194616 [Salvia hispanica]